MAGVFAASGALFGAVAPPAGATSAAELQQNAGAINSIVSNVASQTATAKEDAASAKAQQIASTGNTAQATSYGTAAKIATNNAQLEGISGQIQQVQSLRSAFNTIGGQRAAVAASGFGNAGSSLDLLRSSTQQAYLNAQVLGVNSNLAQAGFLGQAAASQGEASAATSAASAATVLSKQEAAAGTLAQANALSETVALSQVFPNTAATNLATQVSKGTPGSTANYAGQLAQTTGLPVLDPITGRPMAGAPGQQFFGGQSYINAPTTNNLFQNQTTVAAAATADTAAAKAAAAANAAM